MSTTTKADVSGLTSGVRARVGPVEVFNPQGIGGVPSTFRWNPVHGCEHESVASRRADGFANAVSLARAGAWQWAAELGELRGEAHKTAATIKMVLTRALSFMSDPALARSVLPRAGERFEIEAFRRERGTLYLIAESEFDDSPIAPLFAAMAGEIHHVAAHAGQASAGGARLGALFLDEGFGSLDADALASSLAVLQAETGGDKLVAVFSHLHAVAEAVQDVMWVERRPDGSSARWLTAAERDALVREEVSSGLLNLM